MQGKLTTKERIYIRSEIPLKFINSKVEHISFNGEDKKQNISNMKNFEKFLLYKENLENNLLLGKGLAICGPVGVAKTMLMTILSKDIINLFYEKNKEEGEESNRFLFIQATSLYDLANRYGLNDSELRKRKALKSLTGLWIDDLTKFGETGKGNEMIYLDDIIRFRDLNMLSTFYTIQVPFELVKNTLNNPIYDIIRGNCEVIEFIGDSRR